MTKQNNEVEGCPSFFFSSIPHLSLAHLLSSKRQIMHFPTSQMPPKGLDAKVLVTCIESGALMRWV